MKANPSKIEPSDCRTMADVRHGIDALDRAIVALLGERFRYIEAAARIKQDPRAVRDEPRIDEVIANVRAIAAEEGVPPDIAAELYRLLIEASVSYEMEKFREKGEAA
jgi:isochorismate pyruvate lyase